MTVDPVSQATQVLMPPVVTAVPPTQSEMDKKLSAFMMEIGFKLIAENHKSSTCVSPYGIAQILGMLFEPTEEKEKLLAFFKANGCDLTAEQLGNAIHRAHQRMVSGATEAYAIAVKNNCQGIQPKAEEGLKKYGTEVFKGVDDLGKLNQWVKDKTQGRISKMFDSLDPNVLAVYLHALLFDDKWKEPFNPACTFMGSFKCLDKSSKTVQVMSGKEMSVSVSSHKEAGGFKVVFKEFLGTEKHGLRMMYIVFDKKDGYSEFLKLKNKRDFIMAPTYQERASILAQKIKILGHKNELWESLKKFGLPSDLNLELLKEENEQRLSNIIQKINIELDEHGIRMAAVTAAVVKNCISMNMNIDLTKPHFAGVVDKEGSVLALMGFTDASFFEVGALDVSQSSKQAADPRSVHTPSPSKLKVNFPPLPVDNINTPKKLETPKKLDPTRISQSPVHEVNKKKMVSIKNNTIHPVKTLEEPKVQMPICCLRPEPKPEPISTDQPTAVTPPQKPEVNNLKGRVSVSLADRIKAKAKQIGKIALVIFGVCLFAVTAFYMVKSFRATDWSSNKPFTDKFSEWMRNFFQNIRFY